MIKPLIMKGQITWIVFNTKDGKPILHEPVAKVKAMGKLRYATIQFLNSIEFLSGELGSTDKEFWLEPEDGLVLETPEDEELLSKLEFVENWRPFYKPRAQKMNDEQLVYVYESVRYEYFYTDKDDERAIERFRQLKAYETAKFRGGDKEAILKDSYHTIKYPSKRQYQSAKRRLKRLKRRESKWLKN